LQAYYVRVIEDRPLLSAVNSLFHFWPKLNTLYSAVSLRQLSYLFTLLSCYRPSWFVSDSWWTLIGLRNKQA